MPIQKQGRAPYAPGQTLLDVLAAYRDRGLQTPFDKDVLIRAGVSESLAPRTLQALQLLDLINDIGEPEPVLDGLRTAPSDEYPNRLEEAVRSAYAEVFSFVDPATATTKNVEDAFRFYEPAGQRSRMVTLFIALCEAAGIITEEAKARLSSGRTSAPRRQASTKKATTPRSQAQPRNSPKRKGDGSRHPQSHIGVGSLPPALAGLMSQLPKPSVGWEKARRDLFVTTFESVLDFCIPVVEPGEDSEEVES